MRDLGSRAAMRWGSSPHARTTTSSRTSYRSRRRFFFQNNRHRSFTSSLLLSKLNPLTLGFNLGFFFLQSPLNFVSGNSQRLLPKTALTSLRLLPNPKHLASDLFFCFFCKVRSTAFPATARGYCRKLRSLPCASFQIRSPLASDLFFSLLFTDLSEDKQSIVSLLTAVLGAALVKKHDFLATTQRARVVDIILQAEHSSRMVETRKYSKA